MQFLKNGPDIPETLLQAHEDGYVVFFCGAGISYPANLPGFGRLVADIYKKLGDTPNTVEKAAIKTGSYDTAIGLLENRVEGHRETIRPIIEKILTPDLKRKRSTTTHEALLKLCRNRDGKHRLVTTNFDRIFEHVIARDGLSIHRHQAPLLPIPKNRWDGLVYLHGLLPDDHKHSDLDNIIVSSGDFGLAYLAERWAARFVSELFRNYTVCFVGYSINDPVLRYMMDALAADKLRGEISAEVFAFANYQKGKEKAAEAEWHAKNVTPILYQNHSHHFYLHRTLEDWANTYRDGVRGKESIVARYAYTLPTASTKQDDHVKRMLWALSDPSGLPAKRFAEFEPLPSLDWIEPFGEQQFGHKDLLRYGVQPNQDEDDKLSFSFLQRPTPYPLAPFMQLSGTVFNTSPQLDPVMQQIASWLLRHLDKPALLLWFVKNGGELHWYIRNQIELALRTDPPPDRIAKLWRLLLARRVQNNPNLFDLYSWKSLFQITGLTASTRLQLLNSLSPRVTLRPPFKFLRQSADEARDNDERMSDLVEWELVLATNFARSGLEGIEDNAEWVAALPTLLQDFTNLLRDALDIMGELEKADRQSDQTYITYPSITPHPQNNDYVEWTILIELVRDAWLETARKNPELARSEAIRWFSIPFPLFRRFAFFAGAYTSVIPPFMSVRWLLSDDHRWLWSIETQREAMRLITAFASNLEVGDSRYLQEAILAGPPRWIFRPDAEEENIARAVERDTWLLLSKIEVVGGTLIAEAKDRLSELTKKYPELELSDDEREEFPFWMGEAEDTNNAPAPVPKEVDQLVIWLEENRSARGWRDDEWRTRCRDNPIETAEALLILADRNEWLDVRWTEALQAWAAEEELALTSWGLVGHRLADAPLDLRIKLVRPVSYWLRNVGKKLENEAHIFLPLVMFVLDVEKASPFEPDEDLLGRAINHPVGHVAEGAILWWFGQGLNDDEGLDDKIRPIFDKLADTKVAVFRHARILLCRHIIAFFRVDKSWSSKALFPLFDWKSSPEEARTAWQGFLWSPRLYLPLLTSLREQFLDTATHYQLLGRLREQYAAFLTFVALEDTEVFSRSELLGATSQLPTEGQEIVVRTLARSLEGAGAQREEHWKNRTLPYIRYVWPKSIEEVTPSIASEFARVAVFAGAAFPEAIAALKHWFRPLKQPDFLLRKLAESGQCEAFPEEALELANRSVADNPDWASSGLNLCMSRIKQAKPEIEEDSRFQRLRSIAEMSH